MTVKLVIHRGAHAIGGTCVEIKADSGRLILDLGMPLMANGGGELPADELAEPSVANGILPAVKGLFDSGSARPDAVVLSHAHPDHYGLLRYVIDPSIIWISRESRAIIENANLFLPDRMRFPGVSDCRLFEHGQPFSVGAFVITPFLIDHSAFGASTLLIEVEGKRILYSGDLRAHGRKQGLFRALPSKLGSIDCMLLEGTTLGGGHDHGFKNESEVEKAMTTLFKPPAAAFVMASGGNIDRLVSIYRASKKSGKTLVVDLYQYCLLNSLKVFSDRLPPHERDHLRVFYPAHQAASLDESGHADVMTRQAFPRWIKRDEIVARAEEMVIRLSYGEMHRLARKIQGKTPPVFVWSMWTGYLEQNKAMSRLPGLYGQKWKVIHVSGHARKHDLQWLTKAICPKMLVPIHTLRGEDYENLFENVRRVDDKEEVEL